MLKALCAQAGILIVVSIGVAASSHASDVSQSDIVDKLTRKKPATRSLKRSLGAPKSTMSSGDIEFLGSLGNTRGIKFTIKADKKKEDYKKPTYNTDELSKIGDVVSKYNLPKLDFNIRFEFGSAEVSGESIAQVVELAKALNHPSLSETRIILGGHTDAKGSDAFNQILSQKRSDSVARLVAQIGGIRPERLVPVGFGERKLKNTIDPNAAENRRVEVINISTY